MWYNICDILYMYVRDLKPLGCLMAYITSEGCTDIQFCKKKSRIIWGNNIYRLLSKLPWSENEDLDVHSESL